MSSNKRGIRRFFVFSLIGVVVLFSGAQSAGAFSIRSVVVQDPQFFAVLFDGNVSSTTATTTSVTLSTGAVQNVFTQPQAPSILFVSATGTASFGDQLTVTSSVTDMGGNANGTLTAQTILRGVKIAAVRSGASGNNLDEYIMLYNQTGQAVMASGTLYIHTIRSGADVVLPLVFATSSIPGRGFFLVASGQGYSGAVSPDAFYTTSTDLIATATTTVYLSATTTANTMVIDKVEWGSAAALSTSTGTGVANSTSTWAAATIGNTLDLGKVAVRKAANTSVSSTMASGGADSNKGAGYDTRNNSNDFVILDPAAGQNAILKNSLSPSEFPLGGGGSDTSKPFVMGSFPSGNTSTPELVPTDLTFIGFGFSKPVDPSTVTSSTVSLTVQGQNTNLCASVTYSSMAQSGPPGQCNLSGALTAGTTYVFTVNGSSTSPRVQDFSGNPLTQPGGGGMGQHGNASSSYQITFSPQSGFSITPTVPPQVLGIFPAQGVSGVATNVSKISITFSQAMDATTFGGVTLAVGAGANVLTNASVSLSSNGTVAFIPVSGSLTAGATYTLTIPTTVKNNKGIFLGGQYVGNFTAGSGPDTTAPVVIGKLPNIATGVPVNAVDIHVSTNSTLDASTISTSSVQVTDGASNAIPGLVSYDPIAKEIVWVGNNVFLPNTAYTVNLNGNGSAAPIKSVSGLNLATSTGTVYQFSFTTANQPDTTPPVIAFANANTFSVAVTFGEAVKKSDAENIANYSLTAGSSTVSLSSFNNNTATYDVVHRTATIKNLSLTAGASFNITASNIHDLSNNVITNVGAGGTVQAGTQNGGAIGVGGGFFTPTGDAPSSFSSSQFSFIPQPEVRPYNSLGGFVSRYGVNLPISNQIPASGKIVMAFPSAFTLAGAAADAFSPANADINGPGTGIVTINSVAGDDVAHTVTVTLGATPTQSNSGDTHDFLHFDLSGIGNPPMPNSSYTVDVRTQTGTTTLESLTSKPFAIQAGGANSLTVTVNASGASGGTANVYLISPQTGPLSTSTAAFNNGSSTAVFSNLPTGSYAVSTDPFVQLTGGSFIGQGIPSPVSVSTNTATSTITFSATGSLASTTVNVYSDAANRKIDVFGGGSAGFVKVSTSTIVGTSTITLFFPASGLYNVGVGPQMQATFAGSPPAPDYVIPKPVQVNVASGIAAPANINLNLTAAALTLAGTVTDASSKSVANASVFAYSPQGGFGTFGQSGTDGSFRLKVSQGSYKVGASAPGFPASQEVSVVVDGSGNLFVNGSTATSTSMTIKLTKPGTKITGKVTDGTNAIQNAQVWAYCDPGTVNNSCFGPNGHAEAQTDGSGAFTLYVGNGTWKVAAFIPGYGRQPEVSVTVAGSNQSLPDFRPSATGTFNSVSGTVCTNTSSTCSGGTAISGAVVRIEGTDALGNFFSNQTISGADGTYSFSSSVPAGAGSSYRVRGFSPTLGGLPATAAFTVTADVASKDLVVKSGRTVSVNILNAPSSFDAIVGFTNTATGVSNFLAFKNNATGTISVPNGSIYALDARSSGFALGAATLAKTGGTATYSTSTGQLDLTSGSDAVTVTVTMPASTAISGTVKDDSSNAVASAWVDVASPSNGLHAGTQASTSGAYALSLPDGAYIVTAYAPSYVPSPKTLTIAAGTITLGVATTTATAVNLTVIKTSLTISGTIMTNGTAAPNAFVKGVKQGGGTSVVIAGTDGTYSLPVSAGTWTVYGASDGYRSATSSASANIIITTASVASVNINLVTTVTLSSPTVQSIVPTQGGTIRDSGGKVEVRVPANALGSSDSAGQVKTNETSGYLGTATAKPIGTQQDIRAYDSSNNSVTTLNDNVDIVLNVASSTFSANSVNSTSTASKLKISYFDTSVNDWVPIASTLTYADGSNVPVTPNSTLANVDHLTLTAKSNHFTVFGTTITLSSVAPAAPSGAAAALGSGSVVVSWTAPTTNSDGSALNDLMEYEIYRDTSPSGNFSTQVNSSQVASSTTSFTDSSASAGVTYYYKVTATNTSGNESSKSAASNGASWSSSSVSAGWGGGGGGASIVAVITATSTVAQATSTAAQISPTTPAAQPVVTAPAVKEPAQSVARAPFNAPAPGFKFSKRLRQGARGDEIKNLQQVLAQVLNLNPQDAVTGYFGKLTKKAVQDFQEKYGIAKKGDAGYGDVGPKTQAKLNELIGAAAPAQAQAAGVSPGAVSVPAGFAFSKRLSAGSSGEEVRNLQQVLAQALGLNAKNAITGYFGKLTKKAVQDFQEKYGIAKKGDAGYGEVGPATRAKLNALLTAQ